MPRLGAFRAELGASVRATPTSSSGACSARCGTAAVRTAGSAQRFHRAHRETPWRAASALASALSLGWCSYTACSSRLDESRCHSLPTLILPLALALTLTASSATASPSSSPHPSRPLPHLHLHSCPRTRTLTLTSLHCARRCRLLGASVGAISSLCDATVSGAHRARLLCARRGYLVGRSRSAALLAALLWSTSGPKVSAGACAGGSRLTPGGGQAIPRARLPLGVRCGPRHHRSPAAPPSRGVV